LDINASDTSGCTALLWAARNGHEDTVKYLCKSNADINATGFGGWSALQHAVSGAHENMVMLLLQCDANPNSLDETGSTALHLAAARDVNASNAFSARPLHHGALFGHVACIKKLVECGSEIDAQDAEGNTPLHIAAQMGYEIVVRFLLNNCNKNICNVNGMVPVEFAHNARIRGLLQ